MNLKAEIDRITPELIGWRRRLHAHPELGFREHATAAFVAGKLREFGLQVYEGVGRTGVVGLLRAGEGAMVGLRADMDALPMAEATGLDYASTVPGLMHACGHDGHMAMLLGAAWLLAERPPARGSVLFIFQPAEETEAGGRAMVEDGLFRNFPVDAVYGLHNWPGLPVGQFAAHPGAVMAASDAFEITIVGEAGHAAMPHESVDPIAIGVQLYQAFQLIVSRNIQPTDAAVISVTQMHAGDAWNVIPQSLTMRGTVRTVRPQTRDMIETAIRDRAVVICRAFGAEPRVSYSRRYPATVNHSARAAFAGATARRMSSLDVLTDLPPSMASEDFSYMLLEKPGAYVWLGGGSAEGGRNLHSPNYDFNDALIPTGVEFWTTLAYESLAP